MSVKVLVSLMPVIALYFMFGPLHGIRLIKKEYAFALILVLVLAGFVLSLLFRATSKKEEGRGALTLLAIGYMLLLIAIGLLVACIAGVSSQLS